MVFPGHILRELVLHLHDKSPFYREHFAGQTIDWEHIHVYSGFRSLKYLERSHIHQESSRFRCQDIEITRIYCSGGTLGEPKYILYSTEDWRRSVRANVMCLEKAGITSKDVIAILQPFGIWSIGAVFLDSAADLGARVLPIGIHLKDEDVLSLFDRHKPTVIMAAPGNLCRFTAKLLKCGQSPSQRFGAHTLLLSGEKFSESQRMYLARHWAATALSLYGCAEADSLAIECPGCHTLRLLSNEFLFEIKKEDDTYLIDSDELAGQEGELIVTTLYREGTPLIRYRLGDFVQVLPGCRACDPLKLNIRVTGRSVPGITLAEGTKLYSYQIERAIEVATDMPFSCKVVVSADGMGDHLKFIVFCERIQDGLVKKIEDALMRASIDFADAISSGVVARLEVECRDMAEIYTNRRGKSVVFEDMRALRQDVEEVTASYSVPK